MDEESPRDNNLEMIVKQRDDQGILLKKNKNESGVYNPTMVQESGFPKDFLYRADIKGGKGSVIKLRKMVSPTKLKGRSKVLFSGEDAKVTKINGDYFITYISCDGKSPRIALAITRDFERIDNFGIIGPEIRLKGAIRLVGNERYKKPWRKLEIPLLPDKDAMLFYQNGKYILIHRLEPDIHIAITDNLEELRSDDFWRDYIRNIDKHVFMRAEED